ncbi:MlaC/ttg2D family ABC transporter substrate-binding protein [Idiomarina xiamenensis]|uniref:Organic solvent ABC transporter n=1 Tax=Idiomarina xiamenensis 10-D-4 TaxID=740709 RepID=K2KBZ2_9GAMM|nr:ABC transporter substrate-binding protein [Idiomarina xiamenensis]EKE85368.1 organic solvent ABC transporter [Idiomarina xiamenensis 10-D-4]
MKRLLLACIAVLMSASVSLSATADVIKNDNPYELVELVANKTFERMANERAKIDNDPNYLREIVEDELMPYVDALFATKKVLGRNLKDVSKDQFRDFYKVFRDYLVATYARAFTQYDESKHKVVFEPANKLSPDDRVAVVRARIQEPGRPDDIRLDFKMRLDNNDKIWKAYDLVVEGVSLLNSKQAEIAAVIRQNGIDGTIEMLKDKAYQPIKKDDEVDF